MSKIVWSKINYNRENKTKIYTNIYPLEELYNNPALIYGCVEHIIEIDKENMKMLNRLEELTTDSEYINDILSELVYNIEQIKIENSKITKELDGIRAEMNELKVLIKTMSKENNNNN